MRKELLSSGEKAKISIKPKKNERIIEKDGSPSPEDFYSLDVCTEYSEAVVDGPMPLRAMAFFGGFAMVGGSIVDFDGKKNESDDPLPLLFVVVSIYTWLFGIFVITLEGRPFHLEIPHVHRVILNLNYFNCAILRYTWGRGFFYFFSGSIQFSLLTEWNMICGGYMVALSLLCVYIGRTSNQKMDKLCKQVETKDSLRIKFCKHDKDRDGYLNVHEFRKFVDDLGLEFEMTYDDFVAVFTAIDGNLDKKISLKDFEKCWLLFKYKKHSSNSIV